MYVCGDRALSITADFSRVGSDISQLRKRLREADGIEVHDTFAAYAASFRRRFQVTTEQAWELFHQTVSMKTVGNLTEFVREHMLDTPDVEKRIHDLLAHFDNLTRAHAAVVNAKGQVSRLTPLVADCDEYEQKTAGTRFLLECRDHLKSHFSARKNRLAAERIAQLVAEREQLGLRRDRKHEQKAGELADVERLRRAIDAEGGGRLEQLGADLRLHEAELRKRTERRQEFAARVAQVRAELPVSEPAFESLRFELGHIRELAVEAEARAQNRREELFSQFTGLKKQHGELQDEIASLRQRPSNIPFVQARLRARLADEVGVAEENLPFVGELLQVRESDKEWEGALERLLRSFALSLLVHDEHYSQVARWVSATHLQGRLVYLRVLPSLRQQSFEALQPSSSVPKLQVKEHPRFATWLNHELRHRYDYACVASDEQFLRMQRAVSITGQIKENSVRHVKDDRFALQDRGQYVLGWSSSSKIAALDAKRLQLEAEMQRLGAEIEQVRQAQQEAGLQKEVIASLRAVESFDQIDCDSCEVTIRRLQLEKQQLESASDALVVLQGQLRNAETLLRATEEALEQIRDETARNENRAEVVRGTQQQLQTLLQPENAVLEEHIDQVHRALPGFVALTLENCDPQEHLTRLELQRLIDLEGKQQERLRERILLAMQSFRGSYPTESMEFDVSIEASAEYRKLLEQLRFHDLPRHEKKFSEELRGKTIQDIAFFNASLEKESKQIAERIRDINESLLDIQYNRGRYIELLQQSTYHAEVQAFRDDLRACTDDAFYGDGDDPYAEQKFLQVKQILDRLQGAGTLQQRIAGGEIW